MKKFTARNIPGVSLTRYIVDPYNKIFLAEIIGKEYLVEMVVNQLQQYGATFKCEGESDLRLSMDIDAKTGKGGKISFSKSAKGITTAVIYKDVEHLFPLPPDKKFLMELSKLADIPIATEWTEDVCFDLKQSGIVRLCRSSEGSFGYIADRNRLRKALEYFVKNRVKPFDGELPDEEIPETVSGFVKKYADKLSDMLLQKTKTVYDGQNPADKLDYSLIQNNGFTRYIPQEDAVNAALKRLETTMSVFLGSEMGTGKTLMGIMAAYGLYRKTGKGQRVLVMVPPHLVKKWSREFKKALGDLCTKIEVLRKKADVDKLVLPYASTKPDGIEVYIVPREMAALGHIWRGLNPLMVMKEVGIGNQTVRMPVLKTDDKGKFIGICPGCGKETAINRTARTTCENMVQKHLHYITAAKPTFDEKVVGQVSIGVGITEKEKCGELLYQAIELRKMGFRAWEEHVKKVLGQPYDEAAIADGAVKGSRGTTTQIERVPVMWYLKKTLGKGFFDLFLLDEAHEAKGESARGMAAADGARVSKKTILLTGTLSGGKPSTLFYLLWRFAPQVIKPIAAYSNLMGFSSKYGNVEKVTFFGGTGNDRKLTKGKANTSPFKEKPGVSPDLLLKILPFTSFLKLSDLRADLPAYREIVTEVGMKPEHRAEYDRIKDEVFGLDRRKKESYAATAKAISVLMSFINNPVKEIVTKIDDKGKEEVLGETRALDIITEKEEVLADIILDNKAKGRKTVVFVEYTGKRDMQTRLSSVLSGFGIKSAILAASIKAEKREEWIEQNTVDVDCLICNPRLVMTGLDLLQFPTVVFFTSPFSPYIIRQASRRPWRIGQTMPVEVHFLAVEDTLETIAMKITANRMTASKIFEGEIPDEAGLAAISDIEEKSFVMEMAESIGKGDRIGSLELLWKEKMREEVQQDDLLFAPPAEEETAPVVETTATVVQETATEVQSNRGGKETFVFKKISKVEIYPDRAASFILDGQMYLLKNGSLFEVSGIPDDLSKRYVGKYSKKMSKKTGNSYIEAKFRDGKVVYVGKQASTGEFVALKRVAKESVN